MFVIIPKQLTHTVTLHSTLGASRLASWCKNTIRCSSAITTTKE